MAFEPSGVLTLTTDFGHKGPYVASMKGVVLTRFPGAQIIDLTHETMVHWPAEAGFWLRRAYCYFPAGSVHVAVVDPGVGTNRDIIAAVHGGHVFLAPDNGLLAPVLGDDPSSTVHRLDLDRLPKLGIPTPSVTFHGRDIFAPVGADLASGKTTPAELGPAVDLADIVPSWIDEACKVRDRVQGTVITFDHFGNVITNIDASLLQDFERPTVNIAGHDIAVHRTYGEVTPGTYLALINSFGVLEIARAESSAHDGLGAERGAPVVVREGD